MKRMIAWCLCLCFALGGCAQDGMTVEEGGGIMPKKNIAQNTQDAEVDLEKLALRLAALPELPEEPDEAALRDKLDTLDFNALGAEKYSEEQSKLWDAYNEQYRAYRSAVETLRGDGVDAALTPALAAYTLRTARQLLEGATEENVVYSPANLYLALCMLAETANGESRAQLLDLLGLESAEQARGAANSLYRALYRDGVTEKTLLANSIWLNEQVGFHQDVIDTLASDYYASTFRASMGEASTDKAIAAWIDENTNGLLADAAATLQTDPETLVMLVSTLYFKATWSKQFHAADTAEGVFTSAGGETQKVDFMHRSGNGAYYRGDHFTVAPLPFLNGTSMWFLLPDEGYSVQDALLATGSPFTGFDADPSTELSTVFGAVIASEGHAEIHWSVPKFDVDSDLDLIPALKALGVTDIFTGAADFSPLTDLDAAVGTVKHSARVTVDEEGCEAAAFTAAGIDLLSMPAPLPAVEMDLCRPFGFLVTGADGLPLFVSVVNTMK